MIETTTPAVRVPRPRQGFTFTEAIIVVVLGVLMMGTVQVFFSRSVRNTMKGQDTLE